MLDELNVVEQVFLDDLTSYAVNIRKQNFYMQEGQDSTTISQPWRIALQNNASGREQLSDIIGEPYLSMVMELWGTTPLVPDSPADLTSTTEEEQVKFALNQKLNEINADNQQTIWNGVDVETSQGLTHFNLSDQDQSNINGIMTALTLTKMGTCIPDFDPSIGIWYKADGPDDHHQFWSVDDFMKLATDSFKFRTQKLTYFDYLKQYVNSLTTKEDIAKVYYGMELPGAIANA